MTGSIPRKIVMALTGLFLCLFLVVHLAGNLALYLPLPGARLTFNAYSAVLSGNPLIKVASVVTMAALLLHAIVSVLLVRQNRAARSIRYVVHAPEASSTWYSRNMGRLGALIFAFLVLHLRTFWFRYTFGEVGVDAAGNKDLYGVVVAAFGEEWYALLYVVSMVALGYHLLHGVFSACRTLGLHHRRYGPWIERIAMAFAVAVSAGFAGMPVFVYFGRG